MSTTQKYIVQEIIQGAASPAIGSAAPAGAKFFYNTILDRNTRAVENGVYVALSEAENIVDFNVNANPNTAGTTFSPAQPQDPDVIYHSTIDDSVWIWNGTTYVASTPTGRDFWRSNAGTLIPDGVNDVTEAINRTGLTGIGNVPSNTPVAQLDVARGGRSGTDPRTASSVCYITGTMVTILNGHTTGTPTGAVVEFRHSNQSQGIGIAYDGLYATGNTADQHFTFMQRGNGVFRKIWQNSPTAENDKISTGSISTSHYVRDRCYMTAAIVQATAWYRGYIEGTGPLNVRQQWDITSNGGYVAAMRLQPDMAELGNSTLYVGEQRTNNRKIVMFDGGATSPHLFYGFGVNASAVRYQTNLNARHRFYVGTSATTSKEVMAIDEFGRMTLNNTTYSNTVNDDPSGLSYVNAPAILTVGHRFPVNATGANAVLPSIVMMRSGESGVKWSASAGFDLGTYAGGINAQSQLDIKLGDGATHTPNKMIMSLRGDGRVDFAGDGAGKSGIRTVQMTSASTGVAGKPIGVDATGNIVPLNTSNVTQYGTQYTKEWNSSITSTASSVVFDITAAGFTTVSNIQATAFINGAGVQSAPLTSIVAVSTTSITVLVTESNNTGVLIGGTVEGLSLNANSKTVYLTVKGT